MSPQHQADSRSELERLAELHKLVRDVQREHRAKLTPRGKNRRKVSRGTQRDAL